MNTTVIQHLFRIGLMQNIILPDHLYVFNNDTSDIDNVYLIPWEKKVLDLKKSKWNSKIDNRPIVRIVVN